MKKGVALVSIATGATFALALGPALAASASVDYGVSSISCSSPRTVEIEAESNGTTEHYHIYNGSGPIDTFWWGSAYKYSYSNNGFLVENGSHVWAAGSIIYATDYCQD